jgi:hypothetical protein
MTNLLKTTIRMIIKPRKTARNLIEENNYDLAYWYFFVVVFFDCFFFISVGKYRLPQVLISDNVWWMTINALGYSFLSLVLSLLLQSTIMNLVSKMFKIRSNFRKTLMCITWARGPYVLISLPWVVLIIVLDFVVKNRILMPSGIIWEIFLNLLLLIGFLGLLITIIVQITLLSELYQSSILKTIILHIAAYLPPIVITIIGGLIL